MRKFILVFGWILVVLLAISTYLYSNLYSKNNWWRFSTKGEIYSTPTTYKNILFFGNNIGEFFAIEKRTGEQKWKFEAEHEVFSLPVFHGSKVLFTSADGVLYCLNARAGEELWRFSLEGNFRFYTDLVIHKNTLFVGDANGSLYAVNLKNGKLKWKFESAPVETLSSILVESSLNWFGALRIKRNTIYFASRDGNLYALSPENGSLKWKFESGSPITTSPEVLGKKVYFGNKKGDSYILGRKDGRLIRHIEGKDSVLTCIQPIRDNIVPWRTFLIEVYENGDIVRRTGDNKEEDWRVKTGNKGVFCSVNWYKYLYFADETGALHALDAKSGEKIWKLNASGKINTPPIVRYKSYSFDILSFDFLFHTPLVYFGDATGRFYAVNGKLGKEEWVFKAFGGINTRPIVDKDYLYFGSSDGGLYRLKALTGRVVRPFFKKNKFEIKQRTDIVGGNNIIDFTITHKDDIYTNPAREVEIVANFNHESGEKVTIRGFYYDKNTWKIRFNPSRKGEWIWNISLKLPDETLSQSGSFNSKTDTRETFLNISEKNKKRLTQNNEVVFNGIGIQDAIVDYNYNGTPFDDWAIGNSQPFIATSSAGTNYFPSEKIIDLNEYLNTYGPEQGGFNLYRFGLNNASFNLWDEHNLGTHNKYLLAQGKWGDTFVKELKDSNFHIMMTIFGFGVPFSQTMRPIEVEALRSYIEYVIARYGAYVSIWEITNEAYLDESVIEFIASEIRSHDYENRPISISWEQPELEEIDIISPHWYETEEMSVSDLRTLEQINKYKKYEKPVIIGEQGNKKVNWDEASADRMRIRSWTAFFNEAILVFWNQSDKKDHYGSSFKNANIYLGEEERRYMKILQDFTKDISVRAKMVEIPVRNSNVRTYGLKSDKELQGYFYHYKDHNKKISARVNLDLPGKTILTWIDPSTGEIIRTDRLFSGKERIFTPPFSIDLALKVEFGGD